MGVCHYHQTTSPFKALKNLQKNERLCYDEMMAIEDCTCGEFDSGVVTVYQGVIEHHCAPPKPCWVENYDDAPGEIDE